jgi:hypothetical protein
MPRRPGLLRTAARTAVIAGTATSVAGRVQRRQERKAVAAAPSPLPQTANVDIVESLQHLADLKASGALTEKEYATAKARVLGR